MHDEGVYVTMQIYGNYYECLDCKVEIISQRPDRLDKCVKCEGKNLKFLRSRKFQEIPSDMDLNDQMLLFFNRLAKSINDLQDNLSATRSRFCTLLKKQISEKQASESQPLHDDRPPQ